MSDMIDRLRATASQAGKDAAADLSAASSIAVMDERVRRGRRKRRNGITAAVTATAAAIVAAVIVVPDLLPEPDPIVVGPADRTVVHTDGPLTVYDDGSMSVVLSNGRIVGLDAPDPADPQVVYRTKADVCALGTEIGLTPGWEWGAPVVRDHILGFGATRAETSAGSTSLQHGANLDLYVGERWNGSYFVVNADPAVAPYLVVQHSAVEVHEGYPIGYATRTTAKDNFELQGAGANQVAVVTSLPITKNDGGWCIAGWPDDVPKYEEHHVDVYFVSDVWLTDRAGTAIKLGTYTTWAQYTFAYEETGR